MPAQHWQVGGIGKAVECEMKDKRGRKRQLCYPPQQGEKRKRLRNERRKRRGKPEVRWSALGLEMLLGVAAEG